MPMCNMDFTEKSLGNRWVGVKEICREMEF